MVTMNAVQQGVSRFMDREILPHLNGMEKVVVGGGANLFAAKLPQVLSNIPVLSVLSLYEAEHNMIDIDAVYEAVKPFVTAEAFTIKVPLVGVTMKLGQREINELYNYIKES